jgi:hypothetical protein
MRVRARVIMSTAFRDGHSAVTVSVTHELLDNGKHRLFSDGVTGRSARYNEVARLGDYRAELDRHGLLTVYRVFDLERI